MKKTLITFICILGMYALVACNKNPEPKYDTDSFKLPTEYTYSSFYEINESFIGLTKCETITEGDSE
ncbi:MAG: hypothetical protein GX129_04530 [Clostridiales bacterium]|jgi:hypothetical protein|nr:hypothetical protein [Clostridiales bacterium]